MSASPSVTTAADTGSDTMPDCADYWLCQQVYEWSGAEWLAENARALIATIKDVERTTIEAALTGSADLAVRALALHPLVPSVSVARRIFAGYRERLPELQERFAA